MPTFNQLVRKGREVSVRKSTAPALQKSYNSLDKSYSDANSPQKRGAGAQRSTDSWRPC